MPPVDKNQPKQSSSTKKSAGSRDAASLKHNKNRDLEAPPMPDIQAEISVAEKLGKRGHGAYPPKVVARVLRLAQKGYSISQMYSDARTAKGLPHQLTLYRWRREKPEFRDLFDDRYRDFVDDQARQLLPIAAKWGADETVLRDLLKEARKLPRVKKLEPQEKVAAIDKMIARTIDASTALLNAQDKRVMRTLQIAGRQLPNDWGEKTTGESTMVVIDAGLGIIKAHNPPGSPDGQNVQALKAGRWEEIRKGAEDA